MSRTEGGNKNKGEDMGGGQNSVILCDTLNVMDVQVSRRRDSITQR